MCATEKLFNCIFTNLKIFIDSANRLKFWKLLSYEFYFSLEIFVLQLICFSKIL